MKTYTIKENLLYFNFYKNNLIRTKALNLAKNKSKLRIKPGLLSHRI